MGTTIDTTGNLPPLPVALSVISSNGEVKQVSKKVKQKVGKSSQSQPTPTNSTTKLSNSKPEINSNLDNLTPEDLIGFGVIIHKEDENNGNSEIRD